MTFVLDYKLMLQAKYALGIVVWKRGFKDVLTSYLNKDFE
jgi:hypothetical protein